MKHYYNSNQIRKIQESNIWIYSPHCASLKIPFYWVDHRRCCQLPKPSYALWDFFTLLCTINLHQNFKKINKQINYRIIKTLQSRKAFAWIFYNFVQRRFKLWPTKIKGVHQEFCNIFNTKKQWYVDIHILICVFWLIEHWILTKLQPHRKCSEWNENEIFYEKIKHFCEL